MNDFSQSNNLRNKIENNKFMSVVYKFRNMSLSDCIDNGYKKEFNFLKDKGSTKYY